MLDIRTLFFANFAATIMSGFIMVLSRRWQRDTRSVGIWGAGALCFGVGMALSGMRDIGPLWLCVIIGNMMVVFFPLIIWNGVRLFNDRPTRWRESLAVPAVGAAVMAYFLYVADSFAGRVVDAASLFAATCILAGYELIRWTRPVYRPLSWLAAVALLGIAVPQLARVAIALTGAPQASLFVPTLTNQIAFLDGILASTLLLFCLVMMANQELQIRLTERSTEMERIARDRDAARQRAEQANLAKSTFLTMMSHELRTPLNAILGFSEMAPMLKIDPPLPERFKEYFSLIHGSGDHLLRMINDILDLSKVEAGKMEIEPTVLDVHYAIKSTLHLVAQQATDVGLKLEVKVDTPPPTLFADERAVRQILFNLLSNATRFTPAGGVVGIHAAATEDGGAALTVHDTGTGIPKDQIARVTMPFEQIDNAYGNARGGTGLGLPLVDGLVRLHGGHLVIESELGVGTRVTAFFPPAPASGL